LEDTPELSDKQFWRRCSTSYAAFAWQIEAYLEEEFNPDLIAPALLDEWCDAVGGSYDPRFDTSLKSLDNPYVNTERRVSKSLHVIENASNFDPRQVEFAERMIARFQDLDMHEGLAKAINPLLGK
jgi:hypothetical protein